jgi:drug/metabolite transporter (DMT)-like permease
MSDTSQTITQSLEASRPAGLNGSTVSATVSGEPLVLPLSRVRVILAFLSIYVIWGSTYLAIRYAVADIPPLFAAGMRHLAAGSILLVWCLAKGLRPTWAQIRASVVIGFFFFLVGHGLLHWAELVVPSGMASLFIAIEPIIVFLLASAASRTWRLNGMLVAGILLGLAGVGVLVGATAFEGTRGSTIGAIAIIISAISWSAGIIYSRYSKLSGNPMLLSALSLLSGSAMLLFTGAVVGEAKGFSIARVTPKAWLALAYLIVFGSVIAFSAYNWLLEHYSPTLVATHTYVNPIVAVLLGWLYGGEVITFKVLLAAAMVVGAVILVDRGTNRLASSPPKNVLNSGNN